MPESLFLKSCEDHPITVENYVVKSNGVEELLGLTMNSYLNFKEHILNLCKKTNRKLHLFLAILSI